MSDEIVRLEDEVARCYETLRVAQDALYEAKKAASPIKLGEVYRRTRKSAFGEVTDRGRVVGFRHDRHITPLLRLFKSDGSDGARVREMIWPEDWEREEMP